MPRSLKFTQFQPWCTGCEGPCIKNALQNNELRNCISNAITLVADPHINSNSTHAVLYYVSCNCCD